jgi:hypothetical protein
LLQHAFDCLVEKEIIIKKEQSMERSFHAKKEDLDLASLVEIVLSWTFNDVRNQNLCKHKVYFSFT